MRKTVSPDQVRILKTAYAIDRIDGAGIPGIEVRSGSRSQMTARGKAHHAEAIGANIKFLGAQPDEPNSLGIFHLVRRLVVISSRYAARQATFRR